MKQIETKDKGTDGGYRPKATAPATGIPTGSVWADPGRERDKCLDGRP